MAHENKRKEVVEQAVSRMKRILAEPDFDRPALDRVAAEVTRLAAMRELWSAADFPDPEPSVRQARYLIREDDDRTFALYLNVMRRGNRTPIHNHTTWACIAGIEGAESNYLYSRVDDGSRPGYADVVEKGRVVVRPGTAVALMPNDIHAVEIETDGMIRHLHMYGRALETLTERVAFDLAAKTYRKMEIGVETRRLA